jgi:hypothetical protein
VGLQKSVPGAVLAADRNGIKSVAVADVVDGGIAHLKPEIVQGTDDAIAAPSWVFCDQFDDEFFKFRIHGRSTDWIGPGKGPLFGDEGTEPTEQGVWSDQSGDLAKAPSADELGFASNPDSLGIGKAPGFAAQLFKENTILPLEEFDDRLLVSVHPAGDGNKEELELSCHGVKNLSNVAAAQSSKGPRLSFLVVQSSAAATAPPN